MESRHVDIAKIGRRLGSDWQRLLHKWMWCCCNHKYFGIRNNCNRQPKTNFGMMKQTVRMPCKRWKLLWKLNDLSFCGLNLIQNRSKRSIDELRIILLWYLQTPELELGFYKSALAFYFVLLNEIKNHFRLKRPMAAFYLNILSFFLLSDFPVLYG